MEVPQAIPLRQLSEQERRTNILLQELGRPTVDPNMVANAASSEDSIPLSRAILKDDEESISGDSDDGPYRGLSTSTYKDCIAKISLSYCTHIGNQCDMN